MNEMLVDTDRAGGKRIFRTLNGETVAFAVKQLQPVADIENAAAVIFTL